MMMWGLAFLLPLASYHCQRPIVPELPSPRIVIVGPTGAGKSSLANALLGCDPRSDDCMFTVCPDLDSCTKETTIGTGPWLGTGQNFTVVDTPGLGDSDNQDEKLIDEMMNVLANTLDHADTLLVLFNGENTRFSASLQKMMKTMTIMFGQDWWSFVVIGVSFWPYDQDSINERTCDPDYPQYCRDEAWFEKEMNKQMKNKTSAKNDFSFVFTDAWSQTPGPPHYNTDDSLQQESWQREAGKLWEITTAREDVFTFMTIDDILEENSRQRVEIKWLNDVITNNITQLQEKIGHVEEDLIPGIGSIIPWIPSPDGHVATLRSKIPDGWQKCDGSLIMSGPLINQRTPDLNGKGLFLRGGEDSMVTTVQEDMVLDHTHVDNGHTHVDNGHTHVDGGHHHTQESHNHRPPNHDDSPHQHGNFLTTWGYGGADLSIPDNGDGVLGVDQMETTFDEQPTIQSAHASIQSAKSSISSAHSGMSSVSSSYKKGSENRPANMAVTYIMRIV